MLSKIIPTYLNNVFNQYVNLAVVNEIHFRKSKPVVVFIGGQAYFVGESGLTNDSKSAIIATKTLIEDIVFRASECSIYSVNEQIKRGFIMSRSGVRIGISGNAVSDEKGIITISNYSSLNFRIPHEIKGASLPIFEQVISKEHLNNTLIVSPPGAGKTTLIRDLIYQISKHSFCMNVFVVDERGEIACGNEEKDLFSLGNFCDVMSFLKKPEAIRSGVRSMNPQLIVCDEIGDEEDVVAVKEAMNSGVKVIATIHCDSMELLKRKNLASHFIKENYFDRYILLSSSKGPGTIEGVYDSTLRRVQ